MLAASAPCKAHGASTLRTETRTGTGAAHAARTQAALEGAT